MREYREAPSRTRGGSRMRELGSYGSVRGARGNSRPYREQPTLACEALRYELGPTTRIMSVTFRDSARVHCGAGFTATALLLQGLSLRFTLFISLLAGNFAAETGSK